MKRRIVTITLATCFLLSACANKTMESESTEEVSVAASTKVSVDNNESSEEVSAAEEAVSTEASTEATSVEDEASAEESTDEKVLNPNEIVYDDSDYCGYYHKDGVDDYLIISASEKSGIYEVTLFNSDLKRLNGLAMEQAKDDGSTTFVFQSYDGKNQGFFLFNEINVMYTNMSIDESGEPSVKINIFPQKSDK